MFGIPEGPTPPPASWRPRRRHQPRHSANVPVPAYVEPARAAQLPADVEQSAAVVAVEDVEPMPDRTRIPLVARDLQVLPSRKDVELETLRRRIENWTRTNKYSAV